MQVEVDVKCMQFNFGGHGLFSFGDFAPFSFAFKMVKISLRAMGYSPWGSKNRIGSKKFMQVEIDVKCMQTNFSVCGLFGFGDLPLFHLPSKRSKFPFKPWAIVHGGQKIESAQKIHASRG